ncbi:MAG: nitroreductase family deazaflavin-dependent oxidoreductase [Candidatus Promineifilaceae bacterium]|jgi:deazaflavin-dependent oxidoreductase (nitroreductase family)
MSDQNEWNRQVIEEFRANEGKVGGFFENATLLLLHTTGAKSGKERINPLMYLEDDGRYVIIASAGGAQNHPDWYYNVVANPLVDVEMGTEEFQARATVTDEPERTELYATVGARYPNFIEYQEKTDRVIPVITLERLP